MGESSKRSAGNIFVTYVLIPIIVAVVSGVTVFLVQNYFHNKESQEQSNSEKSKQTRELVEEISWRVSDIQRQVNDSQNIYPRLSNLAYTQIGYRFSGVIPLKQEFQNEKLAGLLLSLRSLKPKSEIEKVISDMNELEHIFYYEGKQIPNEYDFEYENRSKFDELVGRLGKDLEIIKSIK